MFPAEYAASGVSQRVEDIKQLIPKDFQMSPLGKKLYAMEKWSTQQ